MGYDQFMLEREAREKRRKYAYGRIARLWRCLAARAARGLNAHAVDRTAS